jgi:hypothetical protein
VTIYDAVTGVFQQSLSSSEAVTKIQTSPDGTTLFFAHSCSVTIWDVQTGGLVHTFTVQSKVNDIAVSTSGDHIACSSSDGSVTFWNICTRGEGELDGDGQPVVIICWLSPQKLAVATENSLYICSVTTGETLDSLSIPDRVWGMVYFQDKDEFLVGTSRPSLEADQELHSFVTIPHRHPEPLEKRRPTVNRGRLVRRKLYRGKESPTHPRPLTRPTPMGKELVCITPPKGVRSFSTESYNWTNNPPLLGAAESVAVSLNRNLVAQTKDSIQIFSIDVLTSGEAHNDTRVSHVYPLGENHIICVLQPTRHIAVLELETLRELSRDDETSPLRSLSADEMGSGRSSFTCDTESVRALSVDETESVSTQSSYGWIVKTFNIPMAIRAWLLDIPLAGEIELPGEGTPQLLYGLSPAFTRVATVYGTRPPELWVNAANHGDALARLPLEYVDWGSGEIYDLVFDSETRFYLRIDGPWRHVQIPYDITASPSGEFSHTITRGNRCLFQNPGHRHRTLSMRTANGPWTHSPERSAGSHRRICGGERVDTFGLACRSSWLGVMVL